MALFVNLENTKESKSCVFKAKRQGPLKYLVTDFMSSSHPNILLWRNLLSLDEIRIFFPGNALSFAFLFASDEKLVYIT